MASTFTTNFGIEKIGTGEQSGTWGTTTNYNIDILDRITSYKSVTLSDAATATLTVRAGSPSSGSSNLNDGMYRVIKFGGTLSQACTITISPSTTTAYFIIQNGTSGSQNIIIKQGSGAQTVTIANGKADIVYADASDEVISIGSKLGVSFDIVNDTSPQLGGDLDMNGQDIVTTSNADIELAPNGTGKTVLKGNTNPGTMVFNCESNSHGQTVKSQPHSASVTNVLTLPPGGDQEIVGTTATQTLTNKTIGVGQLSGQVAIANGGTGSSSLAGANIVASNANTTFTKALRGSTQTAGSQTGSVTLDFDTYQNFVLTATGNVTLANPSTEAVGQSGIIVFIQDGTGSRTLSLGTDYETAGGAGLTLSTAANAVDVIPYFVKASGSIQLGAPQLAFA
tara:strand:- start:51 stop:1238 length:1188 start_codon:yes stop_codon:yes gene_type:complete